MNWALIVIGLLACAALALLVVTVGRRAGVVAGADVAVFIQRHGVPGTEHSWRLVGRYLARTRRFRTTWLGAGVVVAVAAQVAWFLGVHAGFNPVPPMADVMLVGFGAWFLGLMHAEAYNRRPRYHGPRLASLEPRTAGRYRRTRTRVTAYVIAAATAVACALSLATVPGVRRSHALIVTIIALVLAVGGELCQRGIARRVRVVTTPDLQAADEAIRALAAEAVDLGAAGVLLVITHWQVDLVLEQHRAAGGERSLLMTVTTAGLFVGIVTLAGAARRLIRPTPRERWAVTGEGQGPPGPVPDR